ncbi:response regulator [Oxalicibacterium solurbis]|uniref:Virulence sensor protein BvgS n=1 Tax=Oxalicibacterium solurbis TaxID=69280 RepID=A0A8J3AYA6_9BURK|nr:response regulator [Oxalicibacterium solurbis]GGI53721.1 two-component system sensor histidine kinase/response regulator [Oxalicibacterium solurbis]
MTDVLTGDQKAFRRILMRNISVPLVAGFVTSLAFVGLILYLLSVMTWVEHSERVIGTTNEVNKLAVDMETGMRGYLLTGDDASLKPYLLGKPRFAVQLGELREGVADNQIQVARLNRIAALHAQWDEYAQQMIKLRRTNGDFRSQLDAGIGKVQFDQIREEMQTFLETEQRLRKERNDDARKVTYIAIAAFVFLSLAISGLLAYLGRRELLQLSTTYSDALREQAEHAAKLQHQAWLRSGQTQLAERSIGRLALPALGSALLDFLSHYVKAQIGALYMREEDGTLRRIAAYGFSHEDESFGRLFHDRDSLVGQAAAENRTIHLDSAPGNYLKVNSGLGNGAATNIIVAPVDNEGTINGVVELGFLHTASPRDIEFLTLVAGNIGVSIEAARYRQRLQDVLAETQQLNEELQVQQEELRTSNEELEEQSRVLEESQAHLENQKAELEQTNEQLSAQTALLDQKNTALNQVQTQLEERAVELQRASRYKSEFLANMSHELRTPLNSSLILAKLLSDNPQGNLNDEQVKFAQTIYSAGNDLLNLINDILDISKVEAGKLELAPEEIPLRKLIDGLKMTFEPLAAQKKLGFKMTIAEDTASHIFTDRQRLEQILKNLLSNAIKFTTSGNVELHVSQDEHRQLRFAVQDSGIGIPADQQQLIFDAFHQADGTASRRYGGTGLGLSISRDLAVLLGGTIHVCSEQGEGSTFTLVLPPVWQEQPSQNEQPAVSIKTSAVAIEDLDEPETGTPAASVPLFDDDRDKERGNDRSVLVIEDDPAFAGILYDLAHQMHYHCVVAQDAQDGLQLASACRPDAILLDMQLPDRSGLSVLQQLKENSLTRHIPVHIVSAFDRADAAMHLGAIGYAVKPTSQEQLMDVFRKLEEKFTQKIKRVLLVEDDERQRDSVVQLIGDSDVEITAVERGDEALRLLRATIFDCMIIDLKLPDMQGNELLQHMSTEEICSFPPVIVYTGRNLTRDEEADLLKYSRSIIIKGARSPERLLDEVTLFLHKVESELSSERQTMLKTVRNRDRVFEGRRILLVDDDVRNIFALTSVLEQKGLSVDVARNGFEALDKLDVSGDDIDLVLMDVMMPGMDGLEATRRIRANARFTQLPIIAITAKAMKDDQEQCMRAGANDYLAKPVHLDRLYSLLRVWMPNMERI